MNKFEEALKFIQHKDDQGSMETEEYYHIFKYHGEVIKEALSLASRIEPFMDELRELVKAGGHAHRRYWKLGGCSGRMITDSDGYYGDGFLADFDTKENADFCVKAANLRPLFKAILGEV